MASQPSEPSAQVGDKEILSRDDPRISLKAYQRICSAGTGAVITPLIMTPMDVVRIRLQAQKMESTSKKCFIYCNGLMDHMCPCLKGDQWYRRPSQFNGTWDALIKIARNEGITSLWSGLSPTLVVAIPTTVIYFTFYEQLRIELNNYFKNSETNSEIWVPMLASLTAQFSTTSCVSPVELIRTRMQSKRSNYYDLVNVVEGLVKLHGWRGLWKGVTATLWRDVPFSGIYWMCYENMKSYYYPNKDVTFWFSFATGSASGTLAAFVTTPFDVVKTRQQLDMADEIYIGKFYLVNKIKFVLNNVSKEFEYSIQIP
ncbi:hypothetical protein J6590_062571 [Homalodisca vitripennis]|nr:hypothetical protein J6590_062571 [Homalodisca vitripennis]